MPSTFLSLYKSFVGSSTQKSEVSKPIPALLKPKTTARLSNDIVGTCPFCQQSMSKSSTAGAEVFVCFQDRYVAPVPNAELGA